MYKTVAGYAIYIVSNNYNPSNFWAGRWRSVWNLFPSSLDGSIHAQVHYYEDGNVQLNSTKDFSSTDLSKVFYQLAY